MLQGSRPRRRWTTIVPMVMATTMLASGPAVAGTSPTLYATDFSDPATTAPEWQFAPGVTSESGDGFTLTMTTGAYTIGLEGARNVWTSPDTGRLPANQVVETTITDTTGDPSLTAGVVCRGDLENDKGYAFLIGLDGYYSIASFGRDGARIIANPAGTERTDAVDPDGPNEVQGTCRTVGKRRVRVTLVVNGEMVATAVDRTASTRIGPDAYLISEVGAGATGSVTFSSFRIAAG